MFTLSVELDKTSERTVRLKLDNITKGMRPVLRQAINASVIHIATVIKRDYLSGDPVHVRTGTGRRAVFSRMEDDLTGLVGVGREAPYMRFVNYGTRPRIIAALRAKALRLVIGGVTMFRKWVMHPGTQATLFMEKAMKVSVPKIREIVSARIARFVTGRGGE